MKRLIFFSILLGLSCSLHAQKIFTLSEETGIAPSPSSRTILCPEAAIYSHQVNYINGIVSMEGVAQIWDQIETDPVSPISQIVFFGVINGTPDRNFTISFYNDNAGTPGSLIASYTGFIAGVNTGEILFGREAYSYTYTFPVNISINAGEWVSVVAAAADAWYWLNGSGGDGCIYHTVFGNWCDNGDAAFCLVGGSGAQVPFSSWALVIGIALIGIVVVARYRRML